MVQWSSYYLVFRLCLFGLAVEADLQSTQKKSPLGTVFILIQNWWSQHLHGPSHRSQGIGEIKLSSMVHFEPRPQLSGISAFEVNRFID